MRFTAAFRSIVGHLRRNVAASAYNFSPLTSSSSSTTILDPTPFTSCTLLSRSFSIFFEDLNRFDPLTDTRYPKRRPQDKPRRKRASLRASGPSIWVNHVPGEPIKRKDPNKGSVKGRNERKRAMLKLAFIKSERKKRKEQMQEANRKKMVARVERKMAAAAREREWTQRLSELQKLEEEKQNSAV